MLDIFVYAINAVLPIVILIMFGYLLKQSGFLTDDFLRVGNKFVFRICLPALLFYNVYNVSDLGDINWSIVWFSLGVVILLFLIGLAIAVFFVSDRRRKGVVLQCVFRSNYAIIGVSLAEALGGSAGVALVSILSAFIVPTFNILAVIALSIFVTDGGKKAGVKDVLKSIVTNPLIIGVLLGLAALLIRSVLPVGADGEKVFSIARDLQFLYKVIESLAKMASPLALIVLGGQFVFSAAGSMMKEILLGTLSRIVLAPAIGLSLAALLNKLGIVSFGAAEYTSFVSLFGTPVAVSSAIMAGAMGSDEQLAGQYVVWTSLGSMVTIFIITVILRLLGCL